jgi:hypothetical protein
VVACSDDDQRGIGLSALRHGGERAILQSVRRRPRRRRGFATRRDLVDIHDSADRRAVLRQDDVAAGAVAARLLPQLAARAAGDGDARFPARHGLEPAEPQPDHHFALQGVHDRPRPDRRGRRARGGRRADRGLRGSVQADGGGAGARHPGGGPALLRPPHAHRHARPGDRLRPSILRSPRRGGSGSTSPSRPSSRG